MMLPTSYHHHGHGHGHGYSGIRNTNMLALMTLLTSLMICLVGGADRPLLMEVAAVPVHDAVPTRDHRRSRVSATAPRKMPTQRHESYPSLHPDRPLPSSLVPWSWSSSLKSSSTFSLSLFGILHGIRGGSSPSSLPSPPSSGLGIQGRVAPRLAPRPSSSSSTTTQSRPSSSQLVNSKDVGAEEDDDKRVGDVSAKEMMNSFLTRESRNAFIARVYGILTGQLVLTSLVCLLFGLYPPLTAISRMPIRLSGQAQYTNPLVVIPLGGIVLSTISWFTVCASPQARRRSPQKWWWLSLFTIGEAISVGCVSSLYDIKSVVLAMCATAVATVTVSAYTILQSNPKYDLSQWGATLSSWAMILLVYALVGIAQNLGWMPFDIVPFSGMMYSAFASVLFSLYLAHHTKLIVGGKHSKYRMNDKDYVFGAMALYVDIVNIFLVRVLVVCLQMSCSRKGVTSILKSNPGPPNNANTNTSHCQLIFSYPELVAIAWKRTR